MKQISSVVVLIGGLIAGYFLYPTLHAETKTSPNYEQVVQNISKAISQTDAAKHDDLLMHEVLEQNSQLNAQFEKQKEALEIEKQIRETAFLKAALESLKTPEAKQALLNLTIKATAE